MLLVIQKIDHQRLELLPLGPIKRAGRAETTTEFVQVAVDLVLLLLRLQITFHVFYVSGAEGAGLEFVAQCELQAVVNGVLARQEFLPVPAAGINGAAAAWL